ncbi:HYC_CC_PP family protein [Algoriphagus namhaensis]
MKSLVSISLLLFFLLGQVNLAWATHYCGDNLISSELSLAPEKPDCCGDTEVPMDCCEDEITQADADDFFGKPEIQVDLSPEFVLAYFAVFFPIELSAVGEQWPKASLPVAPIRDFQILYQSFLI